jgi:transcription antitermination factor NusG
MENLQQSDKKWFALYTRSRAEKKAKEQLLDAGIDCYLPIQKTLRQWSDRKKKVDKVVLPSYIFVKIEPTRTDNVFVSDHLVAFVRYQGKPAIIPDKQIEAFKRIVESDTAFEINPENFPKGSKVKVVHGSLKGIEGEIHEIANNKKLIVSIDQVGFSLSVEIPPDYLEKIPEKV